MGTPRYSVEWEEEGVLFFFPTLVVRKNIAIVESEVVRKGPTLLAQCQSKEIGNTMAPPKVTRTGAFRSTTPEVCCYYYYYDCHGDGWHDSNENEETYLVVVVNPGLPRRLLVPSWWGTQVRIMEEEDHHHAAASP